MGGGGEKEVWSFDFRVAIKSWRGGIQ
jgi:hypothetical protein